MCQAPTENPYAIEYVQMTPEESAMLQISTAYRMSGRHMSFVEDALYSLWVRQAQKEGHSQAREIACFALRQQGLEPRYVVVGELGYIEIEPSNSKPQPSSETFQ